MMIIVVVDVAFRYFNAPINGPTEIIQASIVVIVYLQIAHTLKEGRVTRSDAFFMGLRRRFPLVGSVTGALMHAAGAALMAVIAWLAWPKWLDAYDHGYFIGAHGVFTFPEWPIRFAIWFGCALLLVQFLIMAADELGLGAANEKQSPDESIEEGQS
ncbi:TRAP transporter small permease subunit [Nitratireductor luteus]|uniref:TRAP transporter small permease subunit n=1 Tax=Nitratireductor luteus TaxID=2976980 RepID=UPI00223EB4DF|nr:TRAP transporter small permease [Nitratireductor luteus]